MSAGKPLTDSLILLDRVGNYPPDSVGNNSDLLIRMLAVGSGTVRSFRIGSDRN